MSKKSGLGSDKPMTIRDTFVLMQHGKPIFEAETPYHEIINRCREANKKGLEVKAYIKKGNGSHQLIADFTHPPLPEKIVF